MERMGSKILEFHNVGKGFADKQLFEGFSYKFKRAEKVGIIGPNGTGKSTLLNILSGLLSFTSGEIIFDNLKNITKKNKLWLEHTKIHKD